MALRKISRETRAIGSTNFNVSIPIYLPIKFHVSLVKEIGTDFIINSRNENSTGSIKLRETFYELMNVKNDKELFEHPELQKEIKKFSKKFRDLVYEIIEEKTGKDFSKSMRPYILKEMGIE